MSYYKHGNGRIQRRSLNGTFRHATLEMDFGLSTRICNKCGALNPYELRKMEKIGGFVMAVKNDPPETCSHCGEKLE